MTVELKKQEDKMKASGVRPILFSRYYLNIYHFCFRTSMRLAYQDMTVELKKHEDKMKASGVRPHLVFKIL